jgi:hypothetical protein
MAFPSDWANRDGPEPLALAGGTILVSHEMAGSPDDRLTVLLALAVAHVELRQASRFATQRDILELSLQNIDGPGADGMRALRSEVEPAFMAEVMEREADTFAVRLLKNAGFDPNHLLDYLRSLPEHDRLEGLAGGVSTRPPKASRIAAAEKAIAGLQ